MEAEECTYITAYSYKTSHDLHAQEWAGKYGLTQSNIGHAQLYS